MRRDQQVGGMQRVVGAPHPLPSLQRVLHQLQQRHVLGQDDDVGGGSGLHGRVRCGLEIRRPFCA